jgi:hypothetical protein
MKTEVTIRAPVLVTLRRRRASRLATPRPDNISLVQQDPTTADTVLNHIVTAAGSNGHYTEMVDLSAPRCGIWRLNITADHQGKRL